MSAILPKARIGILGGGQLGRMIAMSARTLGFDVWVLDPNPQCAAAAVADHCIVADFDDAAAAESLARACAVITYEIEKIGALALQAASRFAPVRPRPEVLRIVQDRGLQKGWLIDHGFPVGPYAEVSSWAEMERALASHGTQGRLKTRVGGYDGKGQSRFEDNPSAKRAWGAMEVPCVLEEELILEAELSVLVARRPQGETVVFPPARNWHQDGVLTFSVMPAALPEDVLTQAKVLSVALAEQLDIEGLLAIEFFWLKNGELKVNELSPRPHNTFHSADAACVTSQFEQLVRAICDLPLGSTEVVRPTALANLFGDWWLGEKPPPLEKVLAMSEVHLNLYGKEPRRNRKIGHLLATATDSGAALAKVKQAQRLMSGG